MFTPARRDFLTHLVGATGIAFCAGAPARSVAAQGSVPTAPPFPLLSFVPSHAVGDIIPKDQGGKFIQMEVFGTEDDAEIVRQIRAGRLHAIYGTPLGWAAFERTAIEKSVWLNRLYYLPSFARLYRLSGDRRYLDDMMDVLSRWWADNPLTPEAPRATYNWRDMQVAWRAIHLSWCDALAADGLTPAERAAIDASLREHADILLAGFGRQPLSEFNHQSHGALAMLYLGVLYPWFPSAPALRDRALAMLDHHIARAFHADGGNVEQMFGYYPFVAHIFRDTALLCRAGGLPEPPGLQPLLRRMQTYLTAVAQPDGVMPAINDSFDMPAGPIIETLAAALETPAEAPHGSRLFPDTQLGVLRDTSNGWHIVANPASTIGAHSHAGRLGLTIWHAGAPLLVDSGCCNYDNPALVSWYRRTRAHNTAIIDGREDEATSTQTLWVARRATANRVSAWDDTPALTACRMVSPADEPTNGGVAWTRTVVLVKGRFVVVHDDFSGAGDHRVEVLWHTPPEADVALDGATARIGAPVRAVLVGGSETGVIHLDQIDGLVSVRGVSTAAAVIRTHAAFRDRLRLSTVIHPAAPVGRPTVAQRAHPGGTEITVQDAGGRVARLFLPDPDARDALVDGQRITRLATLDETQAPTQ